MIYYINNYLHDICDGFNEPFIKEAQTKHK